VFAGSHAADHPLLDIQPLDFLDRLGDLLMHLLLVSYYFLVSKQASGIILREHLTLTIIIKSEV
jgi:hypothetical protein